MNHREIYLWLLQPPQRQRLVELLGEQGYLERLNVKDAQVIEGPIPYLRLTLPDNGSFSAHSGGIFLDLAEFPALELKDRFYMLVVAFCASAGEQDLRHELLHLGDLLDMIERDPDYPRRAERLSLFNVADPALLAESIDFEVGKIFSLEPQAHRLEYQHGTTAIKVPFLGMHLPYHCASAEDFVSMWMAEYLRQLQQSYEEKFPGQGELIDESMRQATDRHGTTVFGASAYQAASALRDSLADRILAQMGLESGPGAEAEDQVSAE